jgi:hypothetical protein
MGFVVGLLALSVARMWGFPVDFSREKPLIFLKGLSPFLSHLGVLAPAALRACRGNYKSHAATNLK